jgi:hypothetical protein
MTSLNSYINLGLLVTVANQSDLFGRLPADRSIDRSIDPPFANRKCVLKTLVRLKMTSGTFHRVVC